MRLPYLPQAPRGLLAVVALAAMGYLLVTVPPQLAAGYRAAGGWEAWTGKLYLGVVGAGVLLLLALAGWGGARLWGNSLRKARVASRRAKNPSELSRRDLSAELGDNLRASRDYAWGLDSRSALRAEVERAIAELESKREARRLEIVAFGTVSSGKSSLLNTLAGRDAFQTSVLAGTTTSMQSVPWPDSDSVILVDTPGLAEVAGEARAAVAADAARDADLVLLVVDGPLKEYEHRLAERLAAMEKRLVVCLNKEDWYDPPERDELLRQLREQTIGLASEGDVVAVRSRPTVRPVVRVDPQGVETPGEATVPPDIAPLADRLLAIVEREGGDLLLANLLMRSRGLVDGARERVLATLDAEADRLVDRYTWAAAGAAAANPVPLLDLAIGSGLLAKMALDLAGVYKQRVDGDAVVEMLAQLGKNLVAMLGASAAAPAIGAAVGSLLKTVPGVGWIAGGLLQGVVQAIVAQWVGRVFKAYYRAEMRPPPGGLAELARHEWAAVTSADELRRLVTRGRERLGDHPSLPK